MFNILISNPPEHKWFIIIKKEENYGIDHVKHYSQENGQAEATNKTLLLFVAGLFTKTLKDGLISLSRLMGVS